MRRFKKEQLDVFRNLLHSRRRMLDGNVSRMEQEAIDSQADASKNFNHMADMGSDNYDQEFTLGRIENEKDELREIDVALGKLDDGTFGACEECGAPIPKTRLKALPYTRLCITCKESEEKRA